MTDGLDVDNPSAVLDVGFFRVQPNTWYNISLSVVGKTVNAWIDQTQVVSGHKLLNWGSGWAAIGASVQQNHVYTYAQFDNFAVYGNQIQCPLPAEGDKVKVVRCGGLLPCVSVAY